MSNKVEMFWPEDVVGSGNQFVFAEDYRAIEREMAALKSKPSVVVISDDQIVDAMRKYLSKGDGGYLCDTGPDEVAAAGRALISEFSRLNAVPTPAPTVAYKDDQRPPQELSTAGCRCVRFGDGNPHWPCSIHPAPTVEPAHSDAVIVPSELLYRIKNVYALGLNMDAEMRELRALLNGGRS